MSSITNLLKIKTKSLCRGLSSVLEVCPSSSLMDCQVTVRGRSLRPSTRVRLETRLEDKEQYFDYRSVTELMTDSDGQFRTDIDSALPGSSYTGIHKSGPLWSLQRRPGAKYRLAPDDITKPLQYNLTLTYPDSPQVISTAQATKSYVGEGVRRVEVREGDLRGALFLPASPGPAIITIYGGINNGKIPEDRAALLASHGFVTLALAFFGVDDLPPVYTSFDLNYFETALDFLLTHPHVTDRNKVRMFGSSTGGNIVLAMMSCLGDKMGACVVSGSQFICSPGPMYYRGKVIVQPTQWNLDQDWDNPFGFRRGLAEVLKTEEQLIPFHRSAAPLLVLSGLDDGEAKDMAPAMVERAEAAGKKNIKLIEYPDTGHLIDLPHSPHTYRMGHPLLPRNMKMNFGGQLQPHALAQIHAWSETLEFFRKHV